MAAAAFYIGRGPNYCQTPLLDNAEQNLMKISHKLILSFLLVASLACVTTFFTLRSYREINKTFAKLMDDSTRTIEVLNGIKQAGERVVSSTSGGDRVYPRGGLSSSPAEVIEEERQLIESGYKAFDTNIKQYDEMYKPSFPRMPKGLKTLRR